MYDLLEVHLMLMYHISFLCEKWSEMPVLYVHYPGPVSTAILLARQSYVLPVLFVQTYATVVLSPRYDILKWTTCYDCHVIPYLWFCQLFSASPMMMISPGPSIGIELISQFISFRAQVIPSRLIILHTFACIFVRSPLVTFMTFTLWWW